MTPTVTRTIALRACAIAATAGSAGATAALLGMISDDEIPSLVDSVSASGASKDGIALDIASLALGAAESEDRNGAQKP